MNTEDFVTYEQALDLKKLGFDWCCDYVFTPEKHICPTVILSFDYRAREGYVDAPTLAQAQKWLNKIKDLKLFIIPSPSDRVPYSYTVFNTAKTIYKNPPRYYSSYEESLSAGITECLKILEKKD